MKMFEKLMVGTCYKFPTDEEMDRAEAVYNRFVECLKARYGDYYGRDRAHSAPSLAAFLLEDADYRRLDAFEWDKGVLVRIKKDGRIGMTTGWTPTGAGHSHVYWLVKVALATGEESLDANDIEVASIPPEVLEYVKSTLKDKVHGKVDEAFKE